MSLHGPILALNAGSSSLKFGLFQPAGEVLLRGEIAMIGTGPRLVARGPEGDLLADRPLHSGAAIGFGELLTAVLDVVESRPGPRNLAAVGHRVVHGGPNHMAPARVMPALRVELEALTSLDPLHMPHCLAPMWAIASMYPDLPQVACFDTAFHHTIPLVATRIALPRALAQVGLRRYGFHGLSYDYVARALRKVSPAMARGRVVVAHLGSGASLCALSNSRSIATTMGFSVLDGLVMATRCGSLDPGVIFYLARQGHSLVDIEATLYEKAGLLGVSGISSDMQVLLVSEDARAREAIELFTYRVATQTGALVSALGGLDGLVFTAGIGEHAPAIRAEICTRLSWLGLKLDSAANKAAKALISTPDSQIEVRIIATDEEAMIARHTSAALGQMART